MAQKNHQNPSPNRVRKLDNEYIRSNEENVKTKPSRKQLIRRRRRMLTFFAIASVILFSLVGMLMKQNDHLAMKEQKKTEVSAELDQIKDVQEMLKMQIAKLEDDEYIAKLARKEHLMSEEGEIIFTIPKDEQINEKETNEE